MANKTSSQQGKYLSVWHRKQAAMLLHFTSIDYLKNIHKLVNDLLNGVVDPLLELAEVQHRDAVLYNSVWGDRNTSENWANNAWPILKDLQASLAKDIALRAAGYYGKTAVNECLRGIEQYSLEWTIPEEEQLFERALQLISSHAGNLDDTLSSFNDNRWTDYGFAYSCPEFAAHQRKIPKFRVRSEVSFDTGSVPTQTGVYVAKDDPHAALQFVWTGSDARKLRQANTFNDIGLAALNYVGREDMWFNGHKMFDFATSKQYDAIFHDNVYLDGLPRADLAASAVARESFKKRATKWHLIEIVAGEFEEIDSLPVARFDETPRHRILGGEPCAQTGYYFTPSMANSRRHFLQGVVTPTFDSKYGQTIWQWDENQE